MVTNSTQQGQMSTGGNVCVVTDDDSEGFVRILMQEPKALPRKTLRIERCGGQSEALTLCSSFYNCVKCAGFSSCIRNRWTAGGHGFE
ncbi:hypothetical protein KIN20_028016 [Parelaphostrongylus tenuis]|uniref:Uncharacterized protein n=1 Tax=Parelaphostrongylus tenuis TaxID=148309 RepID=A0AAD5WEA4_PARTN|nr:hypothetical protein KIN20_028016 [Parelaphostrongylus tenuis]